MYIGKSDTSLACVSEVVNKVIVCWRKGRTDDHSVSISEYINEGFFDT